MTRPLPPWDSGHERFADVTTPLSEWTNDGVFDTAEKCNAKVSEMFAEGLAALKRAKPSKNEPDPDLAMATVLVSAQCISADDPRLAE